MRYLIIGLGIYGSNLATDLAAMGHEVIGADINPSLVESIKDYISTAYIIDSTDETSIAALPLKNVDLVIVAIGENFGASIRTVAILKKLQVEHIYARAIDKLHESILEGFNIDRIITPEQRAAFDLVNEMGVGSGIESLAVADGQYILKFRVPDFFVGLKYSTIDFEKEFGLRVIAVARPSESRNMLGIQRRHSTLLPMPMSDDERVQAGDTITCFGAPESYKALFRHIDK